MKEYNYEEKQIRNQYRGQYVLLVKDFNSESATKEQLIQIFNQSDIKIVFASELQSIVKPQYFNVPIVQNEDVDTVPKSKKQKSIRDYFGN
jgi:hypothetical protein